MKVLLVRKECGIYTSFYLKIILINYVYLAIDLESLTRVARSNLIIIIISLTDLNMIGFISLQTN